MRLEDLVGQDQATAILRRALGTGHVPHAYLFEGPPGVGKRSAAIALGMALDCETAPRAASGASPGPACGTCETCRRIAAGLHPDVVTFASDGPQIVIDQAQQIVALGQQRPHEARARVIIIDDADRLNANAANCLLKTLEEPLRGTHLVLVTAAPDRLLGTIRSRTQRVRFRPLSEAALLALGARRAVTVARATVAAVLADGSATRFLELVAGDDDDDQPTGGAGVRAVTAGLRAAARARGIGPILDAAADLGNKEAKQQLPDALALLARVYRDGMMVAAGAPELAVLAPRDGEARTERDDRRDDDGDDLMVPTGLPLAALGRALALIVDADAALAGNVNAVMALERLLIGLRREERLGS